MPPRPSTHRFLFVLAFILCAAPTLLILFQFILYGLIGGVITSALAISVITLKLFGGDTTDQPLSFGDIVLGPIILAAAITGAIALKHFVRLSWIYMTGDADLQKHERGTFIKGLKWAILPLCVTTVVGGKFAYDALKIDNQFAFDANNTVDIIISTYFTGLPLLIPAAMLWRQISYASKFHAS
jgi:hypothetical protein